MIVKNSTVPTMDNTIYKLFPLLILTCLSDLVLLLIICVHILVNKESNIVVVSFVFLFQML